jgi:predicted neuraminidase
VTASRGPRDAAVLGLLLAALGAGVARSRASTAPSTFVRPQPVEPAGGEPSFETRFVSLRTGTHSHAASLVETGDGRVRAFWYVGSREGAPDVEIHTAVYDPAARQWGAERPVADPRTTGRAERRYVRKVGNPTVGRAADGTLWLFYVGVTVGGWGGASVNVVTSRDDGETWSPARRLVGSGFLNLGTLVRGQPFLYADGTIGLPVYQAIPRNAAELLRVDATGAVVDRQRLAAGPDSPQPIVLVRSATEALVLTRRSGRDRPERVRAAETRDAGRTWTARPPTPIPNPDASIAGLVRPDGRIVVVLNDVDTERDALSLLGSDDGGATWRRIHRVEDQLAARTLPVDDARYERTVAALAGATDARVTDPGPWVESSRRFMCWEPRCHFEFSYPSVLETRAGEFHLAYTWNRAFIKHVRFNRAWLDAQAEEAADAPER